MQSLVGQTIGDLEILEEIGRGAMGVVYRASQPSLGRQVAVKVLLPELAERDPQSVEWFLREARAAAGLNHPNIAIIHYVASRDDCHYFVMEEVPGRPLDLVIEEDGPLSVERAAYIIGQLASALDYAHAQGVVHRDVKPGNILITPNDTAKLVDFGIARLVHEPGVPLDRVNVGTPSYLSPEQAEGREATSASDLYALGVVLYEMLAGRPPFEDADTHSVLRKHLNDPIPSVRLWAPDAPAGIDGVLKKAMAKRPQDRFGTGREFVEVLQEQLTSQVTGRDKVARTFQAPQRRKTPGAPAPGDLTQRLPQTQRRFLSAPLAGIVLLCLAGALTVFFVRGMLSAGDSGPASIATVSPSATTQVSSDYPPSSVVSPSAMSEQSPTPTLDSTAPATVTLTPSRTPSATPVATATLVPTVMLLEVLQPPEGAQVAGRVHFQCGDFPGAAFYRLQTRAIALSDSTWRLGSEGPACGFDLNLTDDPYFEPGSYQWRVVALDAEGAEISTSQARSFDFLPPTVTPTRIKPTATRAKPTAPRPRPTSTPIPEITATKAPQPVQPTAAPPAQLPNTPRPVEPPTRTPEPLPVPPTRTPEPLPTA